MNFINKALLILVAALLPIIIFTPASAFGQSIYYVSAATGSDVTGDGSPGKPWATIQHAVDSAMATQTDPAEQATFPSAVIITAMVLPISGYTTSAMVSGL